MIYVFEMLLCYWSWLKKDTYWKSSDKQSMEHAEQAISTMLQNVQDLFPRSSGSNWKIPKFHEQLHIPFNIHLFGAHQNIHSGPAEHNHITHTKKPSKLTQKRKELFDWQLANRLKEKNLIDLSFNKINKKMKHQNQKLLLKQIKDILSTSNLQKLNCQFHWIKQQNW